MKKGRIFTVHYGENVETTIDFIKSIIPFLNNSLDLVIINNSPDISIDINLPKYISIIESKSNLGYFGAIKYGISKTHIDDLDYIIVSNNDIKILNDNFFDIIENKLKNYDIIAPSIKNLEGNEQNPHRGKPFSLRRKRLLKIYFSNYLLAFLIVKVVSLRKFFKKKNIIHFEKNIFSPHGAFIIFNRSFFEKGGFIDDGYFLYGEEDSIAAIAKLKGMSIGFIPSLKILHQESITVGVFFTKQKYKFQKNAYKYILNKYPTVFNI